MRPRKGNPEGHSMSIVWRQESKGHGRARIWCDSVLVNLLGNEVSELPQKLFHCRHLLFLVFLFKNLFFHLFYTPFIQEIQALGL